MKALRIFLAAVVIAAGLAATWRWVIEPWRCNSQEPQLQQRTLLAYDAASSSLRRVMLARDTMERIDGCMRCNPTAVNQYMIAAANYRLLGDKQSAERYYETALRYERRPELFLNLGIVQLELGKRTEARANLLRARVFNQFLEYEIPPELRDEVRREANAIIPDIP